MSRIGWVSALIALLLAGCTTGAYVQAEAPLTVEAYPSTYYDGHVVYWVGDRWYAQRDGAWIYYRSEPVYLRDYRHHAGVYRPRPYHRARPRYTNPHRHSAPPARHIAPRARRR